MKYLTRQDWRTVGGQRIYFKSSWEFNTASIFQYLQDQGKLLFWDYEPRLFYFDKIKHGTTCYKPDFYVSWKKDLFIWYEVKGHMDAKSATKIKRFRKYYKDLKLVVLEKEQYKILKKTFAPLIDDWEHDAGKVVKRAETPEDYLFTKPKPTWDPSVIYPIMGLS